MADPKVITDPLFKHVQQYGAYRYNTELGSGECILSKVSNRKDFPVVLSRQRKEECILDAIKHYKKEVEAAKEDAL